MRLFRQYARGLKGRGRFRRYDERRDGPPPSYDDSSDDDDGSGPDDDDDDGSGPDNDDDDEDGPLPEKSKPPRAPDNNERAIPEKPIARISISTSLPEKNTTAALARVDMTAGHLTARGTKRRREMSQHDTPSSKGPPLKYKKLGQATRDNITTEKPALQYPTSAVPPQTIITHPAPVVNSTVTPSDHVSRKRQRIEPKNDNPPSRPGMHSYAPPQNIQKTGPVPSNNSTTPGNPGMNNNTPNTIETNANNLSRANMNTTQPASMAAKAKFTDAERHALAAYRNRVIAKYKKAGKLPDPQALKAYMNRVIANYMKTGKLPDDTDEVIVELAAAEPDQVEPLDMDDPVIIAHNLALQSQPNVPNPPLQEPLQNPPNNIEPGTEENVSEHLLPALDDPIAVIMEPALSGHLASAYWSDQHLLDFLSDRDVPDFPGGVKKRKDILAMTDDELMAPVNEAWIRWMFPIPDATSDFEAWEKVCAEKELWTPDIGNLHKIAHAVWPGGLVVLEKHTPFLSTHFLIRYAAEKSSTYRCHSYQNLLRFWQLLKFWPFREAPRKTYLLYGNSCKQKPDYADCFWQNDENSRIPGFITRVLRHLRLIGFAHEASITYDALVQSLPTIPKAPKWLQPHMARWKRIMEWETMLLESGGTIDGLNDLNEILGGYKNISPMNDLLADYDTINGFKINDKSGFEWRHSISLLDAAYETWKNVLIDNGVSEPFKRRQPPRDQFYVCEDVCNSRDKECPLKTLDSERYPFN